MTAEQWLLASVAVWPLVIKELCAERRSPLRPETRAPRGGVGRVADTTLSFLTAAPSATFVFSRFMPRALFLPLFSVLFPPPAVFVLSGAYDARPPRCAGFAACA